MFGKILIANRGEIACRIIHSAKKMGIETVAVYTDVDARAKHVRMADEAVAIGDPSAYLDIGKIIAAAKSSEAEAIHPGYGFLSENPAFVKAVEKAGLVFIGPSAESIRDMGLKDKAKRLMQKAGVPIIPGYHGAQNSAAVLKREAGKIGYPLLIKARAGGGGKGIRLVEKPADFAEALASAQREARSSFKDEACLLEKYISKPRHIEVQVFCDHHGAGVSLFERDCSLQRRHQKIIEEAPAPNLPDAVRKSMGEVAVKAALSIGYRNAGTVEFIYDSNACEFMFMEMNTRLQVEHPVSEAISGFDFVEWQLRIAAGEKLPNRSPKMQGYAFEARIYAEDTGRDFLPSVGRLHHYAMPHHEAFAISPVRVDSGVGQGDNISPYYDPMIAKLIVQGDTRKQALAALQQALQACHIAGVTTNIGFLHRLCGLAEFQAGDVHTGLIEKHRKSLSAENAPTLEIWAMAALVAIGATDSEIPPALQNFQNWGQLTQYADLQYGDKRRRFSIQAGASGFALTCGKERFLIDRQKLKACASAVNESGEGGITIFADGENYLFRLPQAENSGDKMSGDNITSPLPGVVRTVLAKRGDKVKAGDKLMTIEAMKMEHVISATGGGKIKRIAAKPGDVVSEGALLLEFA